MAAPHVAGLLLLGWSGQFDYLVNGDPDDIYDNREPWGYRVDGIYAYRNSGFKDPIALLTGAYFVSDYKGWFNVRVPYFYDPNELGLPPSSDTPDYPFYVAAE